ncbi:MAG TPA: TldD/PmbA family protein [Pyrinomonadaceae bacterium]|nr:TldD/PmbA family protein [Pyrinomonadaceae bacterium]
MQDYRNLASELVAAFKKQGVDASDVFVVTSSNFNTTVRGGQIEKLQQSISKGLGMRVFKDNAQAMTFTTDFTDRSVKSLASQALDIVKVSNPDKYNGLAPKELLGAYAGRLDIFDESLARVTPERKIEIAREMEAAGRAFDKRVTNTRGSNWSDTTTQVTLANSDGFAGQYRTTFANMSVNMLAEEDGVKQTASWFSFARHFNRLDVPKAVGEEAARRAVRKLGGRKVKSQKVPVVVPPEMSGALVSTLFGAAAGGSIYRKASYLVDKVGAEVASPLVTIMDDATMADGLASRPFDGEGVRSSQVSLVENGVLKTYVCDSYSARRLGTRPTGNTSRGYASGPSVNSTNLYMKPGKSDPKEIIKGVKEGLYLTSLPSFGQGMNSVTGDFSEGAQGFWIENGEITYPVQEITLAGNMLTLLRSVTAVGNDLSFRYGPSAAPTLLISEATVGGA